MAGIHEIVRETPKPQRPPAFPPDELLAELRRRVVRFEDFASMNRELTRLVEARLEELTDATNPAG